VVGLLAWSLSLEGASVPGGSADRTLSVPAFDAPVPVQPGDHSVRINTIPNNQYGIGPTYQVDPYNDIGSIGRREGRWIGAIPGPDALREGAGAVAAGGCSFAIDCDDANLCTDDRCDIAPGAAAGSGACVNSPVANGAACTSEDGVFCNGVEVCGGGDPARCVGTCVGGPNNGNDCTTNASTSNDCVGGTCTGLRCVGVCAGGANDGDVCDAPADCPGGACVNDGPTPGIACTYNQTCGPAGTCGDGPNPCTTGTEVCNEHFDNCQPNTCPTFSCDDNDSCTTETCVSGVCTPGANGGNFCGRGGDCVDRYCQQGGGCTVANGCAFNPCQTDQDCLNIAGRCQTPANPLCFDGRCCDPTTLACSKDTAAECAAATRNWYASDSGRLTTQNACPPCPKYEAGIGDDVLTAVVGPTSLSPSNNLMAGARMVKVGDDYDMCANVPSGFLSLTDMRFVGGVGSIGSSRTSFEFYDRNGNFTEDIFFITATNELLVQRVEFLTPIIIDCQGFMVAHVLNQFGSVNDPPLFYWAAADGTANAGANVDEGTNVKGTLYLESDLDWSAASEPQPVANFIKVCTGGLDAGTPCGVNADCASNVCTPRATDVLAYELVGNAVNEPKGACCKGGATPECNEETSWVCEGESTQGTFLGVATTCASCVGGGNPGAACRRCSGGPNNNQPCDNKTDCPGGTCALNNTDCAGGVCTLNTSCNTGACCITSNGDCELGHNPGSCAAEPGTFQGFGSDCYPNVCVQPEVTGANDCEDVVVSVFNVEECIAPPDGTPCALGKGVCRGDECYVTVTGDNSGATSTAANPDSCYPPNPTVGGEVGWFEGFSVSDCAFVRIDHCGTDPVKIPSYRIIYDACPCGQTVFTKRDPNSADPPDGRGAPHCDEDNGWNYFGPLAGPNTYYYPILSFLGGNFGQYQFHITVKPCPNAVCCHNSCSNSTNTVCTSDAQCPAGEDCVNDATGTVARCRNICQVNADCGAGTCQASCGLMNQLECGDIGGAFLAPPNRGTAVTTCGTNCNTGSCCTGPGLCEDEILNVPITPADCDGSPLAGRYVGGFRCAGGSCVGGANAGDSCRLNSECDSGNCGGSALDLAQPTPCPICEIAAGDNCQMFDDAVNFRTSDNTVPGGSRAADDFRPNGTTITKVCAWGVYIAGDEAGNSVDCGDEVNDNFEIVVYDSDANGLPNNVVGMSSVMGSNVSKAHQDPSAFEDLLQIRVFAYQLTLDSPIGGLDASGNTTYWLEVRNDTDTPANNECLWSWGNIDSAAYNDYSAAGSQSGYGAGAGRTQDQAFCLNINFQGGNDIVRACCDCDEVCTLKTKRDCDNNQASWNVAATVCAGCAGLPPSNDNCSAVVMGGPVADGTYLFDNHCTSTDGPNPTPSELNPAGETLTNDVWYEYEATCTGTIVFTTCATGSSDGGGIDTFIAAYRDPTNRTVCTCPSTANHLGRLVGGSGFDENCTGYLAGAGGFVEASAQEGDCFMIRVGGFGGQGGEQGSGTVEISCAGGGPPPPGTGDNTCQTSGADLGTPCNTNADCPVMGSACGSKSRYLSITPNNGAIAGGTSIKVEVLTMPQFPSMVGDIYFAGVEVNVPNSPNPGLRGAPLQCTVTPNAQTWTTGVLHLWGQAVVPGSTYRISHCDPSGVNCSAAPLTVATGKWGDVVRPFGGGSQPNFGDVSSIVAKFGNVASAPNTARTDIVGPQAPGTPNTPNQGTNFADVSNDVSAFSGFPYGYSVTACP